MSKKHNIYYKRNSVKRIKSQNIPHWMELKNEPRKWQLFGLLVFWYIFQRSELTYVDCKVNFSVFGKVNKEEKKKKEHILPILSSEYRQTKKVNSLENNELIEEDIEILEPPTLISKFDLSELPILPSWNDKSSNFYEIENLKVFKDESLEFEDLINSIEPITQIHLSINKKGYKSQKFSDTIMIPSNIEDQSPLDDLSSFKKDMIGGHISNQNQLNERILLGNSSVYDINLTDILLSWDESRKKYQKDELINHIVNQLEACYEILNSHINAENSAQKELVAKSIEQFDNVKFRSVYDRQWKGIIDLLQLLSSAVILQRHHAKRLRKQKTGEYIDCTPEKIKTIKRRDALDIKKFFPALPIKERKRTRRQIRRQKKYNQASRIIEKNTLRRFPHLNKELSNLASDTLMLKGYEKMIDSILFSILQGILPQMILNSHQLTLADVYVTPKSTTDLKIKLLDTIKSNIKALNDLAIDTNDGLVNPPKKVLSKIKKVNNNALLESKILQGPVKSVNHNLQLEENLRDIQAKFSEVNDYIKRTNPMQDIDLIEVKTNPVLSQPFGSDEIASVNDNKLRQESLTLPEILISKKYFNGVGAIKSSLKEPDLDHYELRDYWILCIKKRRKEITQALRKMRGTRKHLFRLFRKARRNEKKLIRAAQKRIRDEQRRKAKKAKRDRDKDREKDKKINEARLSEKREREIRERIQKEEVELLKSIKEVKTKKTSSKELTKLFQDTENVSKFLNKDLDKPIIPVVEAQKEEKNVKAIISDDDKEKEAAALIAADKAAIAKARKLTKALEGWVNRFTMSRREFREHRRNIINYKRADKRFGERMLSELTKDYAIEKYIQSLTNDLTGHSNWGFSEMYNNFRKLQLRTQFYNLYKNPNISVAAPLRLRANSVGANPLRGVKWKRKKSKRSKVLLRTIASLKEQIKKYGPTPADLARLEQLEKDVRPSYTVGKSKIENKIKYANMAGASRLLLKHGNDNSTGFQRAKSNNWIRHRIEKTFTRLSKGVLDVKQLARVRKNLLYNSHIDNILEPGIISYELQNSLMDESTYENYLDSIDQKQSQYSVIVRYRGSTEFSLNSIGNTVLEQNIARKIVQNAKEEIPNIKDPIFPDRNIADDPLNSIYQGQKGQFRDHKRLRECIKIHKRKYKKRRKKTLAYSHSSRLLLSLNNKNLDPNNSFNRRYKKFLYPDYEKRLNVALGLSSDKIEVTRERAGSFHPIIRTKRKVSKLIRLLPLPTMLKRRRKPRLDMSLWDTFRKGNNKVQWSFYNPTPLEKMNEYRRTLLPSTLGMTEKDIGQQNNNKLIEDSLLCNLYLQKLTANDYIEIYDRLDKQNVIAQNKHDSLLKSQLALRFESYFYWESMAKSLNNAFRKDKRSSKIHDQIIQTEKDLNFLKGLFRIFSNFGTLDWDIDSSYLTKLSNKPFKNPISKFDVVRTHTEIRPPYRFNLPHTDVIRVQRQRNNHVRKWIQHKMLLDWWMEMDIFLLERSIEENDPHAYIFGDREYKIIDDMIYEVLFKKAPRFWKNPAKFKILKAPRAHHDQVIWLLKQRRGRILNIESLLAKLVANSEGRQIEDRKIVLPDPTDDPKMVQPPCDYPPIECYKPLFDKFYKSLTDTINEKDIEYGSTLEKDFDDFLDTTENWLSKNIQDNNFTRYYLYGTKLSRKRSELNKLKVLQSDREKFFRSVKERDLSDLTKALASADECDWSHWNSSKILNSQREALLNTQAFDSNSLRRVEFEEDVKLHHKLLKNYSGKRSIIEPPERSKHELKIVDDERRGNQPFVEFTNFEDPDQVFGVAKAFDGSEFNPIRNEAKFLKKQMKVDTEIIRHVIEKHDISKYINRKIRRLFRFNDKLGKKLNTKPHLKPEEVFETGYLDQDVQFAVDDYDIRRNVNDAAFEHGFRLTRNRPIRRNVGFPMPDYLPYKTMLRLELENLEDFLVPKTPPYMVSFGSPIVEFSGSRRAPQTYVERPYSSPDLFEDIYNEQLVQISRPFEEIIDEGVENLDFLREFTLQPYVITIPLKDLMMRSTGSYFRKSETKVMHSLSEYKRFPWSDKKTDSEKRYDLFWDTDLGFGNTLKIKKHNSQHPLIEGHQARNGVFAGLERPVSSLSGFFIWTGPVSSAHDQLLGLTITFIVVMTWLIWLLEDIFEYPRLEFYRGYSTEKPIISRLSSEFSQIPTFKKIYKELKEQMVSKPWLENPYDTFILLNNLALAPNDKLFYDWKEKRIQLLCNSFKRTPGVNPFILGNSQKGLELTNGTREILEHHKTLIHFYHSPLQWAKTTFSRTSFLILSLGSPLYARSWAYNFLLKENLNIVNFDIYNLVTPRAYLLEEPVLGDKDYKMEPVTARPKFGRGRISSVIEGLKPGERDLLPSRTLIRFLKKARKYLPCFLLVDGFDRSILLHQKVDNRCATFWAGGVYGEFGIVDKVYKAVVIEDLTIKALCRFVEYITPEELLSICATIPDSTRVDYRLSLPKRFVFRYVLDDSIGLTAKDEFLLHVKREPIKLSMPPIDFMHLNTSYRPYSEYINELASRHYNILDMYYPNQKELVRNNLVMPSYSKITQFKREFLTYPNTDSAFIQYNPFECSNGYLHELIFPTLMSGYIGRSDRYRGRLYSRLTYRLLEDWPKVKVTIKRAVLEYTVEWENLQDALPGFPFINKVRQLVVYNTAKHERLRFYLNLYRFIVLTLMAQENDKEGK